MTGFAKSYLILLPMLLVACATPHKALPPPTYAESVMNRPQPQNEAARVSECTWLNAEIHRQQGGLSLAAKLEPGSQKRKDVLQIVHMNMEALQARAQKVGCISPGGVMLLLPPSPQ